METRTLQFWRYIFELDVVYLNRRFLQIKEMRSTITKVSVDVLKEVFNVLEQKDSLQFWFVIMDYSSKNFVFSAVFNIRQRHLFQPSSNESRTICQRIKLLELLFGRGIVIWLCDWDCNILPNIGFACPTAKILGLWLYTFFAFLCYKNLIFS